MNSTVAVNASLTIGLALSFSMALADVGPNQQLNLDTLEHSHAETCCAASILNPDIMVVGCNDDSGSSWTLRKVHYFRSTDGGHTWNSALIAHGGPDCSRAGDPVVCSDAAGRFYAVYVCRPCGDSSRVYAQKSTNGGITWFPREVVQSAWGGTTMDKPWAACDMSLTSPYVNNLYVVWDMYGQVYFKRSTNAGLTFTDEYMVGIGRAPCLAVGADGTIFVILVPSQGVISLCISLDGGITWSAPQQIGSVSIGPCSQSISDPAIGCDISSGPNNGWVYLCYTFGAVGGVGGVYVQSSTNRGATWSEGTRVSDIVNFRQWFPWIAVHPETGDIGVSWLDSRDSALSCSYVPYASLSTNGGTTWCPNLHLSSTASNPAAFSYLMGDYTGVTFGDCGFLSAWPEYRDSSYNDVHAAWWNNGFGLQLTAPSPGDTIFFGNIDTVRWDFRYAPDSLSLGLNRDYPFGEWEQLTTVRSRDRMWPWSVGGPLSDHARLRVISAGYLTFGYTMDSDFAIGLAAPTRLTAYRIGNDIRLCWQSTGAPYYRIYSALTPDGPFTTLEGSTTGTVFLDLGAVAEVMKFYVVRASDQP